METNNSIKSYNSLVEYATKLLKEAKILDESASYISFSIEDNNYVYCKLDEEKKYDLNEVYSKYHELYNKLNIWKQIIDLLRRVKEFKKTPSIMSNEEARIFKLEETLINKFYQIEDIQEYEDEYSRLLEVLQQLDVLHDENVESYE